MKRGIVGQWERSFASPLRSRKGCQRSTLALAQQIPALGDAQMRVVKRPVARRQAAPSAQTAIVQELAPTPLQLIVKAGHGRKCSMVRLPKSKTRR